MQILIRPWRPSPFSVSQHPHPMPLASDVPYSAHTTRGSSSLYDRALALEHFVLALTYTLLGAAFGTLLGAYQGAHHVGSLALGTPSDRRRLLHGGGAQAGKGRSTLPSGGGERVPPAADTQQ